MITLQIRRCTFLLIIILLIWSSIIFHSVYYHSLTEKQVLGNIQLEIPANQDFTNHLALNIISGQQNDREAYFPNFLYYSVEIANAMIDYLEDETLGGFYHSANEQWEEDSITREKSTYDNSQAIIALLKLADAVINDTEKVYASNVAKRSGNALIRDLYDNTNGGFYTSIANHYKKPGIQAKAIESLVALYDHSNNDTYRQYAIDTYEFLQENAWNSSDGIFVYVLREGGDIPEINPVAGDPFDPRAKRVDHNILMAQALIKLYLLESNDKYLNQAREIYEFFNSSCREDTTQLFYTGLNSNDEVVEGSAVDLFINTLVLEFLSKIYNVTGDLNYYSDFFNLFNTIMLSFWDNSYGGFYATYPISHFEDQDKKKYTERQFYAIRALDEAYVLSGNNVYYNLILDVMEFLTNNLYDHSYAGYYQLVNADGTRGDPSWKGKFVVTQSLSIFTLSSLWLYSKPSVLNAVWSPSTPRPQDSVTIIAAAFDADGISKVLFNYSLNNEPYQIKEMQLDSFVGNLYNTTLDGHSPGTTVNFNIIVNDTLGNTVVRETYFFLWQHDEWPPQITEIGFDPGFQIPVNSEFSIILTVQDNPVQGEVKYVRMYYNLPSQDEVSISFRQIGLYFWKATFPEGLPVPGTYIYYFEAIDSQMNFGYLTAGNFYILGGEVDPLPFGFIVAMIAIFGMVVPAGLYTYIEYKKKNARRILKTRRAIRYHERRGKKRIQKTSASQTNTRGKRGTKRIKKP